MYSFTSVLVITFILFGCRQSAVQKLEQQFTITRDSVVTMAESGELQSVHEASIQTPSNWRMEYRIRELAPEGKVVQAGDTVVKFDTREVQSLLDEARSRYEIQQAKRMEIEVSNENDLKQRENRVEELQYQLSLMKNKAANARYEADIKQKELELELKKTELRLEEARKNLEVQRTLNQHRLDLVKLEMRQAKVEINRARQMMDDMFITAPRDGMIIYAKLRRNNWDKVKPGDTVRPHTTILTIPDLTQMKAKVQLNEVDRPFIEEGMKANIVVEAYPDSVFTGKVSYVSRIVQRPEDNSNLKTYSMDVAIYGNGDYRLIPGLSVKVLIQNDTLNNALRVPSWCLFHAGDGFFVRDVHGRRHSVSIRALNQGYAFIQGDVKAGLSVVANRFIPNF